MVSALGNYTYYGEFHMSSRPNNMFNKVTRREHTLTKAQTLSMLILSLMAKQSFKQILDLEGDPDQHLNLIISSLYDC